MRKLWKRAILSGSQQDKYTVYTDELARQTKQIAEIREQIKEVVEQIKSSRISVYVHVSQADLTFDAEMLVGQLESLGYTVPATVDVSVRSLNQVRFYYEEDRSAAERLAADTTRILTALGAEDVAVETRDFTDWSSVKPRRGAVELWL